jgi:RNA polymerase sigma-70 factor (ECF subfamily)
MGTTGRIRTHGLRTEADRLQRARGHGGLRKRQAVKDTPDHQALVVAAVDRARSGDEDGLRLLYLRYADHVYSYVCSIVRDEHYAEDVTQSLFARLPQALRSYEPRLVPFQAWIMRVAHNAAIDHVRAQRLVPCEEVRQSDVTTEEIGRDCLESLRVALASMPTEQREVVVLRFMGGMSPGEIAGSMGRTEGAIHSLQHRGRRRLRTALLGLGAGPVTRAA